ARGDRTADPRAPRGARRPRGASVDAAGARAVASRGARPGSGGHELVADPLELSAQPIGQGCPRLKSQALAGAADVRTRVTHVATLAPGVGDVERVTAQIGDQRQDLVEADPRTAADVVCGAGG